MAEVKTEKTVKMLQGLISIGKKAEIALDIYKKGKKNKHLIKPYFLDIIGEAVVNAGRKFKSEILEK